MEWELFSPRVRCGTTRGAAAQRTGLVLCLAKCDDWGSGHNELVPVSIERRRRFMTRPAMTMTTIGYLLGCPPGCLCLSACLSAVCLSVCVSVCLSVCLPICLSDRPRPFVCIVVSIMSVWGHPSFASLTLSRFVSVFVPLSLSVSPGLRIYAFVRLCVRLSICRRRFVFILNKETCSLLRTVSPYFMYS